MQSRHTMISNFNNFIDKNKKAFSFLFMPFILSVIYITILMPEEFKSSAKIVIQSTEKTPQISQLSALMPSSSDSYRDGMILKEYLLSKTAFNEISKIINLRKLYNSSNIPFYKRLPSDSTSDDYLDLFISLLTIDVDSETNVLTLQYSAHSPKISMDVISIILKLSEDFINDFNKRTVLVELDFSKKLVSESYDRLNAARAKLIEFQNANNIFSPTHSSEKVLTTIASLDSTLVNLKLELAKKSAYLRPTSSKIIEITKSINDVALQITHHKSLLHGDDNDLNLKINTHTQLENEVAFHLEAYKMANIHLSETQTSAQKKLKTIVFITKPILPDNKSYPGRFELISNIFVILLLIFGIVSLMTAIVNDHKD